MHDHPIALYAVEALFAAVAVYGGVTGSDAYLAVGLGCAFVLAVFIPVYYLRLAKKRRITGRTDALLCWEYSHREADIAAAQQAKEVRRSSRGLVILMCVCVGIIFAPFVVITPDHDVRTLLLWIAIPVTLSPLLALLIAPAVVSSTVRRPPCVTLVGRDYILLTNRYLGVNDRFGLQLAEAAIQDAPSGPRLRVIYTFQMKYGRCIPFPVVIPIPRGQEEEAAAFVQDMGAAAV